MEGNVRLTLEEIKYIRAGSKINSTLRAPTGNLRQVFGPQIDNCGCQKLPALNN